MLQSHCNLQGGQILPASSHLNQVEASDTVRILLIDDHVIIRAGLRMLIETRKGYEIVGECDNSAEAVALVDTERPDIILLDLDLGEENGLDFLSEMMEVTQAKSRVILLTGDRDPQKHAHAVRLGALGVVLKDRAPEVLLRAIEKVNEGEVWLERGMVATALTGIWKCQQQAPVDSESQKIASLTEREREVIDLIAKGFKNQQIGDALFISEPTVRRHLGSIFAKLDITDRLGLLVYAFQHSIITPPKQQA
jgi:DNA-binding NarL/FixJ family response regulator